MFGLGKKGPSRPTEAFAHAEGCKVVVADPGFEPPWQEVEEGHYQRTCQCYAEDIYEPRADTRTRLDPLDPSTGQHLGGCEFRDTTDLVTLRAVLKVTDRGDYWRVDCNACDGVWQVLYFAAESEG
jgi:hypothetical protein